MERCIWRSAKPNDAQDEYDDAFLKEKQFKNYVFEKAMEDNIHYVNEELNSEISCHKIENVS